MDHPEDDKFPQGGAAEKSLSADEPISQTIPIRGSPGPAPPQNVTDHPSHPPEVLAPPRAGTTFSQGEVIARRYRMLRFIGQGGMGDVYEAEDLELHERVALKTVRPEIAADTRSIDRFKREIQLARRVTHSNVCRIFDLGYHRLPSGGEITFLTMELLPGESLAGRLRRVGRMTASEALPLVAQMAAALAAAHEAGIVHRDFKPGNVMLAPVKGNEAESRAVVTDFGLARRTAAAESFVASLSVAGEVMGTPTYMAPEQVEGKEITNAADIYALGAVMYEMVTGQWPFSGDTPFAVAVKRLTEPAPSPRTHVPDLDPRWEAAILRCLAREPEERFEKASDVVAALRAEAPVTLPDVLARRRLRNRTVFTVAGAIVAALLAAGIGYHIWVDQQLRKTMENADSVGHFAAVKPRRSVAILGFKNLSGRTDQAWLSTTLSGMLGTELAASERLRTIPGEEVAQFEAELPLADADSFAKETLERIRGRLGSDLVVMGSYLVLRTATGNQIRLDLRLQDVSAGMTIASIGTTGREDQLFTLVSKVGASLREKLGIAEPSRATIGSVQASFPSNPEAARLYAEGLASLRVFSAIAARDFFLQAVKVDPQHPLPHAGLAGTWAALGYDVKAREEARKAFELSSKLPREDRLVIEARYRESTKDWDKAAEIYSRLFLLFPDTLDYGLRLAAVQTYMGKAKDALNTLQKLRALPTPLRDDARIDLSESSAAGALSDFPRQRDAAVRAEGKGKALGARLLVARALVSEGQAHWRLGEASRAHTVFVEANKIYREVGDPKGVADTFNYLANLMDDQGAFSSAKTMYEEAQAIYEEIGNRGGLAHSLNNLALMANQRGDLKTAKVKYEKALPLYREIGDRQDEASVLDNLGNVLWALGDLTGARKAYEEALPIRREISDLKGVGTSLLNIGILLLLQGDLAGAKKMYEESLSVTRQIGDRSGTAFALFNLGEISKMSGDLVAAQKSYQESLEIRNALGEKNYQIESKIGLAEVLLETGKPADSLTLATQVIQEFNLAGSPESEAQGRALEARSLLALGKLADAAKAADAALALVKNSENQSVRLYVLAGAARVLAASGRASEARRLAEGAAQQAKRGGLLYNQFEAELTLGEIEMKAGPGSRGSSRMRALQAESAAKGFGLIARKAAAALAQKPS